MFLQELPVMKLEGHPEELNAEDENGALAWNDGGCGGGGRGDGGSLLP